jgi:hypothetical protein
MVGPALLMRDASDLLHLQVHLFIQQVWESQVKCRSNSHGSSQAGGRNSAASHSMLLFTVDYPDYVNIPCFSWKVALLKLASPWLGLCLSAKVYLHCLSLPTYKAATLLTSFVLGPCLLSTKIFDTALHMSKFLLSLFSYWFPTISVLNFSRAKCVIPAPVLTCSKSTCFSTPLHLKSSLYLTFKLDHKHCEGKYYILFTV